MTGRRTPLQSGRFLVYSLLVHGALVSLFVFNLTPAQTVQQAETPDIIHAITVDESEVMSELQSRRDAITQQQQAEERQRQEAENAQRRAEEERRQAERQREEQAREASRRAQEAEQQRVEQEAARQRQVEEQRRSEEAERQRAEEQRRKEEAERQQRAEAERLKQEEAERKRKAEEEQRRKAEAERKRREEQERQRKAEEEQRAAEAQRQREAELQRQIAEEQAQEAAGRARTRFVGVWGRSVRDAWTRPPGSAQGLSADVRVRVEPTGEVTNVEIIRSSGDATFDRSVVAAIRRASPLPVPDDTQSFRRTGLDNVTFRFNPDQ